MTKRESTLRTLHKELGSQYSIRVIDLEKCLYRDFRNGFNVEISGCDTIREKIKATLYLWYGTDPPNCQIIRTLNGIERTAAAIHKAAEELYAYSVRLIADGYDTRGSCLNKNTLKQKGENEMIIYYGETPKFTNIDKAMFSRGNYICKLILQNRRNKPVALLQNKDADFPIWKIESDFFCVVFPSYEAALAFCKGRYQSMDGEEV